MFAGKLPDITQAQVVAALTWIVAQAVAWGWIDNASGQKLLAAGASVLALGWMLADSYLRGSRVKAHATALTAGRDLKTGELIDVANMKAAGPPPSGVKSA